MTVCRGTLREDEDETRIELRCPDSTEWSFVGNSRESAEREARRVLHLKGYDARLSDQE